MKQKLLSFLLTMALALSLAPSAFAHNPVVPGKAVTMAGDMNSFAMVDQNNDLWVYNLTFLTYKKTVEYYGYGKPEKFDSDVVSVSVSDTHIAYIKTDGSLWIYGCNLGRAAGLGEWVTKLEKPVKVMDNVIAVSVNDRSTAAIRSDNSLWLWGDPPGLNPFGYDMWGTQTPFKVADDVAAVSLASDVMENSNLDSSYGMFLKTDGTLWGWGNYAYSKILHQYGDGSGTLDLPVKLMSNVASFATGDRQCAAVTTMGDLYVWGHNYFGSLGFDWIPDTLEGEYQYTPKKVMSDVAKTVITNGAMDFTIYALKTDGSLWGAGNSQAGQLGEAYQSSSHTPRFVKVMDGVTNIVGVELGAYVTKEDGSLYAMGLNLHQALALGIPGEKYISSPTPTTFPEKVLSPEKAVIGSVKEPAGNPFTDIAYGTYCYDSILWALEHNITTGTSATTFSPQAICTRGQVVTFLWRAVGCPEPKTTQNPFLDVKATDYFYKAVLWAYENGITAGVSDTSFAPAKRCTEAQIITFLWRTKGEPYADISILTPIQQKDYYAKAQVWAYENGMVTNVDSIQGSYYSTRANVVTYLNKAFGK